MMKRYAKRIAAWTLVILLTVNVITPDIWALTKGNEEKKEDVTISAAEAVKEAKKGKDEALAQVYDELQEMNEEEEEPLEDEELNTILTHYAELQKVYEENPDYFGVGVHYFTDKDTQESPLGAIMAVTADSPENQDLQFLDQTILGMTQSLEAYIEYYGEKLLAVRDEAMAQLDDDMSDLEKCLVLHDFLNNRCEFDVAYLEAENLGLDNSKEDGFVKSTPFGALVNGSAVCLGYTSAYAYLVQCAFPEIYKHEDGTWKTKEEVGDDYMIDFAKILAPERHYFNAVKLDGVWRYIDTCYDDIMVQHKQGVRVESEGNLHHMYFLYSHETMLKWEYNTDDNVDSAYKELCTDKTYEDSWLTTINSPLFHDAQNWYYVRGQVDTRKKPAGTYVDKEDQLIARDRKTGEEQVLIDYKNGQVNAVDGTALEENSEILAEYQKDLTYNQIYAGLQHTLSLYKEKIYFNMGSKIFTYDLADGKVTSIKEYNEISAKSDPKVRFIGDSFYAVEKGSEDVLFTIKDRPLASMYIDQDGKLQAFIATNYSWGTQEKYSQEVKNWTPSYGSFGENRGKGDKFRWCANVKDVVDLNHLTGTDHTYEKVTIEPSCIASGYEEMRCKECGISDGERTNIKESLGHHYVYDKAEDTYICMRCNLAERRAAQKEYQEPEFVFDYKEDGSEASCKAIFKEKDSKDEIEEACHVDVDYKKAACEEDGYLRMKASVTFKDQTYTEEKNEVLKATGHADTPPEFVWSDDRSLCYARFYCKNCYAETNIRTEIKKDLEDADYEKDGKAVYTATCTFEGKTYQDTKTEELPMKKAEARFDKALYRLYVTEKGKAKLISKYEEDGFVSIKSSDEDVAKVSKYGTITTVAPGTAEITATTKTGEKVEAAVIVKRPTVTLNAKSIPLQLKKSTTALKVKTKIDTDSVSKWSSSNSSIVYISQSGKMTAKRIGTAKIKVTMKSGATAYCTVKVQKSSVKTTSVYVNRTKVNLSLSGTKTFKLVLTRYPITTTETVTYRSLKTSVATVSKYGTITAKKAGTATIKVTSGKITREIKVTVSK